VNVVILSGNLSSEVEVRELAGGKQVGSFTLAVDRGYKRDAGTDFYRVTVWNGAATNMARYVGKGDEVTVQGHLRTSNYEKQFEDCGKRHKVYAMEVHADEVTYGQKAKRNGTVVKGKAA
jgi:single-strand DNA-binding protein